MKHRRLSIAGAGGVFVCWLGLAWVHASQPSPSVSVWLYANTRYPGVSELAAWRGSLDIFETIARDHWGAPRQSIHRAENISAAEFGAWLARPGPSQPSPGAELIVVYFGSHMRRDGRIGFADGSQLAGGEFVKRINDFGNGRRVVLIVDACFAEQLERCGSFTTNVHRVYSAAANERAIEAAGPRRSPAFNQYFGADRKRASLLALLLERSVNDLARTQSGPVRWLTLSAKLREVRDELARHSRRTHVPQLTSYGDAPDVELR